MPILGLTSPGPSLPAHFSLERIIRPNILALAPYRCARDDYDSGILLDANENAIGPCLPGLEGESSQPDKKGDEQLKSVRGTAEEEKMLDIRTNGTEPDSILSMTPTELASLNRYPSPTHAPLKSLIAKLRGVPSEEWVFLGVGSDEVIDLLFRVTCVPGKDVVITTPPTYGMYKVTANVNDVGVAEVPLITEDGRFEVDEEALNAAFLKHPSAKLLFLCSPGNPTGTLIPLSLIRRVAQNPNYTGVIVVDEAYIDFAEGKDGKGGECSAVGLVKEFGNVCVSQTLSKGFGLAGIRLGFALASPPLVQIMTNTKAPYNVSKPTASLALSALSPPGLAILRSNISRLIASRTSLITSLSSIPQVGRILGGNHANFILVEILDGPKDQGGKPSNTKALEVYKTMAESMGVVVRFRGNEVGCLACLRITVGTEKECEELVGILSKLLG